MKLLSAEDVARRTQLCPVTIHRALRSGELAGKKVRNRWLITEEAFAEWIAPTPREPEVGILRPGRVRRKDASPYFRAIRGGRA